MSRSNHGTPHYGKEYWSPRGYPNVRMATPGRFAKTLTHRTERRQARKVCFTPEDALPLRADPSYVRNNHHG
jgi:hypothetical protein